MCSFKIPVLFLVRGTFSSSANQTRSGVSAGIHRGKQLFGRGAFGNAFWFGLTTASKCGSIDLACKDSILSYLTLFGILTKTFLWGSIRVSMVENLQVGFEVRTVAGRGRAIGSGEIWPSGSGRFESLIASSC